MTFSVQPSRQFLTLVVVFFLFSFYSYGQSITVGTIDDLRSLQPGSAQEVIVEGYHTTGDGGGGTFSWNASSREQDNGGTIFIPDLNPTQGRWIRDTSGYDYYNIKWFGAKGDDSPNDYNHKRIQATINYAMTSTKRVFIPIGIYQCIDRPVNLNENHSGIEIFGIISETVDGNGFRIIDERNSSILKFADEGVVETQLIVTNSSNFNISNDIHIRDLGINGNGATEGHNILVYHGGNINAGVKVKFDNIISYNGNYGMRAPADNVTLNNILVYDIRKHGISGALSAYGTHEKSIVHNLEAYNCGHEDDGFGFNFAGRGSLVEANNIKTHYNFRGMKFYSTFLKIDGGIFKNNVHNGLNSGSDMVGKIILDNIQSIDNGHYGISLVHGEGHELGSIYLRNNSTDPERALPDRIFNAEVENLIVEDNQGIGITHALSLSNTTVNYLKVQNNKISGLRVNEYVVIKSGKILNNSGIGIIASDNSKLEIFNTKFGDTQQNPTQTQYEISGSGATLKHGNLDFSESQVSQSDRINVGKVEEVGAIYIKQPETGVLIKEEKEIAITTIISHPSARITKVEFYADGTKIGERTEAPYTFTWTDIPSGSYRITARATFDDNSTAESNAVRVYVSGRHTIILNEGWNNISSFIDPGEKAIESVFKRVENNVSLVNNNNGDVYWPLYDINEIGNWNYHEGYQVFMHAPDTLVLYGKHMVPEATPIQLSGGWNLTSYLPDQPMPVEKALESIGSSLEIVTNNTGDIYWPDYDVNTLEYMYPGEGYKVFLSQAAPLTYPNGDEPAFKLANTKMGHDNSTTNSTPEIYKLKSGITGSSAILLVESDFFRAGDEVGVWNAAGALVGSGVVKNKKAAITVWGRNKMDEGSSFGAEQNEPLRLTVWHNDGNEEHDLTVQKVVCIGRGELDDPSIRYEENTAMLVNVRHPEEIPDRYTLHQNFPNPFNPSTTIQYHIPRDESVTLTVYNLLGQKVETLVDERQQAGSYEILFKADQLASGVYFYRLRAGNYTEVKRMILLR